MSTFFKALQRKYMSTEMVKDSEEKSEPTTDDLGWVESHAGRNSATLQNLRIQSLLEDQAKTITQMAAQQSELIEQNKSLLAALAAALEAKSGTNKNNPVTSSPGEGTKKNGTFGGQLSPTQSFRRSQRTVRIEMAAGFSRSKFSSTISRIRQTECPPSHALAFIYTTKAVAKAAFSPGSAGFPVSDECGGVPLCLCGPDEMFGMYDMIAFEESEASGSSSGAGMRSDSGHSSRRPSTFALTLGDDAWARKAVLAGNVAVAVVVPRMLLWPFPLSPGEAPCPLSGDSRGPFRVLPHAVLAALSHSPRHLSMAHAARRAYELSLEAEEESAEGRFESHSTFTPFSFDADDDLDELMSMPHSTSPSVVTELSLPATYENYLDVVSAVRATTTRAGRHLQVLYHYTNQDAAPLILANGLRMSTQGQGDGGTYFSTRGPSSYGFGIDDGYERRLIVDCFGEERLGEFLGNGKLGVVLVCTVEAAVLVKAPGGRENALMVPKEYFRCLGAEHEDDVFYLPRTCVQAALLLDSASPPPFTGEIASDTGASSQDLVAAEARRDEEGFAHFVELHQHLERMSSRNKLARVPSSVPFLPATLMARQHEIDELKKSVLEGSRSRFRTLAVGGGGVGKSTLCCALVNDHEIRSVFDIIVWVCVGQEPNLTALEDDIHFQLTSSPVERSVSNMALPKAATGRRVLVVLNDLWDSAHAEPLSSFLDRNTRSHVLVSTRISRMFKDGAKEIKLGPLEDSAARSFLLTSAGIDEDMFNANGSAEELQLANEVVELTGRRPLALSIAAGLIESHGSEITQELVAAMKHGHLLATSRDSGEFTLESTIISASLNSLKGRDKKFSTSCFYFFSVFREDAVIPVALFDLLSPYIADIACRSCAADSCSAGSESPLSPPARFSNGQSGPPLKVPAVSRWKTAGTKTKMLLRLGGPMAATGFTDSRAKHFHLVRSGLTALLRLNLISGSLQLGVSVHDVVRDHVMLSHTPQQLAAKHTRVVSSLLYALDSTLPNEKPSAFSYIKHNLWHHFREALNWEGQAFLSAQGPVKIAAERKLHHVGDMQEPPNSWFLSSNRMVQEAFASAIGEANLIGFAKTLETRGDLAGAARAVFFASFHSVLPGTEFSGPGENRSVSKPRKAQYLLRAIQLLQKCESPESVQSLEIDVLTAASTTFVVGSPESESARARRKEILHRQGDEACTFGELASVPVEIHFDVLSLLGFSSSEYSHENESFDQLVVEALHQVEGARPVCVKAAELATTDTMRACYGKMMATMPVSWLTMIASHSEKSTWSSLLTGSEMDLEQFVAMYDFERDHRVYKHYGARVDYFLQGWFVLNLGFMHGNKRAMRDWLGKAAAAYSNVVLSDANLHLECSSSIMVAAPALLCVCGEDACHSLLKAMGLTWGAVDGKFSELWNSPLNPLISVVHHVDMVLKLLAFLSSPPLGHGNPEDQVDHAEVDAWIPSPEALAAADRTWALQNFGSCSAVALGAQAFERLGRFDDAAATARLGLGETQHLRKHNAIAECHRVLGRVAMVQGEAAAVVASHFNNALTAAKASSLPFLVHLTELDVLGLKNGK